MLKPTQQSVMNALIASGVSFPLAEKAVLQSTAQMSYREVFLEAARCLYFSTPRTIVRIPL